MIAIRRDTMPPMRRLRWTIGGTLLLLQLGGIVYARFVPARYFAWAPYDMQTEYTLQVTVNGRELSPEEIQGRYRVSARGRDNRSYQHVIDVIEQTEQRYHPDDKTEARLTYRINGKQEQEWRYHQP